MYIVYLQEQYAFLYDAVYQGATVGETTFPIDDVYVWSQATLANQFKVIWNTLEGNLILNGMKRFLNEHSIIIAIKWYIIFQFLDSVGPQFTLADFTDASAEVNINKNSSQSIIHGDHSESQSFMVQLNETHVDTYVAM